MFQEQSPPGKLRISLNPFKFLVSEKSAFMFNFQRKSIQIILLMAVLFMAGCKGQKGLLIVPEILGIGALNLLQHSLFAGTIHLSRLDHEARSVFERIRRPITHHF